MPPPLNRLREKTAAFRDLNFTKSTHHPAETGSFFKGQHGSEAGRSSLLKGGGVSVYLQRGRILQKAGDPYHRAAASGRVSSTPDPRGLGCFPLWRDPGRLQPFSPEQGQQDPCWDTRSPPHSSGAHHLVVKWTQPPKLFLERSVHLGLYTGHTHRGRLASQMLLSDVQTD